MSLLTPISGTGKAPNIRVDYPDLNASDQELLTFLYTAKMNKEQHPKAYEYAQKLAALRMLELAKSLAQSGSPEAKLRILARLSNYHIFYLANCIPLTTIMQNKPGSSNARVNVPLPASLEEMWKVPVEISPSGLMALAAKGDKTAQQLLMFLNIKNGAGFSYLQYVQNNVSGMIFLPCLREYFAIFNNDDFWSTAEELSGYTVVDTYEEKKSRNRSAWITASFLIHSAAYIEYFQKNGGSFSPSDIANKGYARRAYVLQVTYYNDLLLAAKNHEINLSEAEISEVQKYSNFFQKVLDRQDY